MMDVIKKRPPNVESDRRDRVLTSSTVQKSFAILDRFNHPRIFSFYLCCSDSR